MSPNGSASAVLCCARRNQKMLSLKEQPTSERTYPSQFAAETIQGNGNNTGGKPGGKLVLCPCNPSPALGQEPGMPGVH